MPESGQGTACKAVDAGSNPAAASMMCHPRWSAPQASVGCSTAPHTGGIARFDTGACDPALVAQLDQSAPLLPGRSRVRFAARAPPGPLSRFGEQQGAFVADTAPLRWG